MASLIKTEVLDKVVARNKEDEQSKAESNKTILLTYLARLEEYRERLINIADTFKELKKRGLPYSTKICGIPVEYGSVYWYRGEFRDAFKTVGSNCSMGYCVEENRIYCSSTSTGGTESHRFGRDTDDDNGNRRILNDKVLGGEDIKYVELLERLAENIGTYVVRMEEYLMNLYK